MSVRNAPHSTLKLLSKSSGGTMTNRMKCGCVCFHPSIDVVITVGSAACQ